MVAISTTCPDCKQPAELGVEQSFVPGHLVWREAARCEACGLITEADGNGLPPEAFRDAVIDDDGYFVLRVMTEERVKTLHVLNVALRIPMDVLAVMMKRLPGNVLGGTCVEMEWLCTHLAAYEIASTVEKIDRESLPAKIDLAQCRCAIAYAH